MVEVMPSNNAFENGRSQASLRSLARAVQRERWASESPLQVAFACYNQKAAAPLPPARSGRRLHVPYRSNRPAS